MALEWPHSEGFLRLQECGCGPILATNRRARWQWCPLKMDCTFRPTRRSSEIIFTAWIARGKRQLLSADIDSSSINGCRVGNAIFFSTAWSSRARSILYGRVDTFTGRSTVLSWQKQISLGKRWFGLMGLFQYGNAFLPDGQTMLRTSLR